jgi:hypothetical protein
MELTAHSVALRFFRSWPESLTSCPALHSSLQSLETSFILLAMGRFPHALVSCASAHQGVLKLAPNLRSSHSSKAVDLYARAVALYPSLAKFDTADLDAFRRARNKYVHEGFTDDDNAVAAELLLKVGFPFLRACYDEFYEFDFVDALVAELGEQLRISLDVYQMARNIQGLSCGYCFSAFGHLIQWSAGQSQLADWEHEASTYADETGVKYERCIGSGGSWNISLALLGISTVLSATKPRCWFVSWTRSV